MCVESVCLCLPACLPVDLIVCGSSTPSYKYARCILISTAAGEYFPSMLAAGESNTSDIYLYSIHRNWNVETDDGNFQTKKVRIIADLNLFLLSHNPLCINTTPC